MSEQSAKMADPRIVVVDSKSGQVDSKRYHLFLDCSFIKEQPPEEIETLGERETRLLGLKVCSVCERRKTGGPAVEALKDILTSSEFPLEETDVYGDTRAWHLVNELKQRGIYLSVRKADK